MDRELLFTKLKPGRLPRPLKCFFNELSLQVAWDLREKEKEAASQRLQCGALIRSEIRCNDATLTGDAERQSSPSSHCSTYTQMSKALRTVTVVCIHKKRQKTTSGGSPALLQMFCIDQSSRENAHSASSQFWAKQKKKTIKRHKKRTLLHDHICSRRSLQKEIFFWRRRSSDPEKESSSLITVLLWSWSVCTSTQPGTHHADHWRTWRESECSAGTRQLRRCFRDKVTAWAILTCKGLVSGVVTKLGPAAGCSAESIQTKLNSPENRITVMRRVLRRSLSLSPGPPADRTRHTHILALHLQLILLAQLPAQCQA